MAGHAARASKAQESVKETAKSLPTRKATTRKGPLKDRAKVAQDGPGRGVVKARIKNQAHIAALVDPSTLDEWDDEELARGYRKDKNGRFTGRPPLQVPYVVAQEMRRRAEQTLLINIAQLGPQAALTLKRAMNGIDDDPKAAVAAAKLVLDRMAPVGKHDTLDVSVSAEPAFLKALQGAIVIGSADDSDIIDAEVIDDQPV